MTSPTTSDVAADVELAVQRVRIRLGLRLAWLTHLLSDHSEAEVAAGDLDRVAYEQQWRAQSAPPQLIDALATAEASLQSSTEGRLARLSLLFGLSAPEQDLVQICLASGLDDRLARQFAAINGSEDRRFPTEAAAGRLCDWDQPLLCSAESPLRIWDIIRFEPTGPGEPEAIRLDRAIASWIVGLDEFDPRLVGVAHRHLAPSPLQTWPIDDVIGRLIPVTGQPDPTRIVVRGPVGSGRRTFAASVCAALGMGALLVDLDRVNTSQSAAVMTAAQRQASLDNCGLVWVGEAAATMTLPPGGALFPLHLVVAPSGATPPPAAELTELMIDLPRPGLGDRERLWSELVPASDAWTPEERADLIERPHVTVGDINFVGQSHPASATEAADLLRQRSRGRVGPLVTALPLPYGRHDLILPERVDEALDLLLFECRQRRTFWESTTRGRLFPRGGLVALLAGPPGVGKTMAAQVVAADLGVDLLRVNLAETISKYVGETAKNLDRVLTEAAEVDAVLLCDEADTLFGQRTEIRDAHDRWANADTNFLLQAIEDYPGVALLATNKRDQLDEAFLRRLRHVIDLPKPDADLRFELWTTLLVDIDPGIDVAAIGELLKRLANGVESTGAEIKHAVLNAAFGARKRGSAIEVGDILAGLDRELAKEGRGLSELERRRLLDD